MTEAAFWSMIRSALRQKSRWWKPIAECKNLRGGLVNPKTKDRNGSTSAINARDGTKVIRLMLII